MGDATFIVVLSEPGAWTYLDKGQRLDDHHRGGEDAQIPYDVQVKSFRLEKGKGTPYVFLQKEKVEISPWFLLTLVNFVEGEPPILYLVRSCIENQPNPIFESRDYGDGRKSLPEWGLTLSKKKLASLAQNCLFHAVVAALE